MHKSQAYDYPTRIFHWVFVVLFIFSFSIGKFIDDDSKLYAYHMLSGLLMCALVLWRILWGFVGPHTVRFSGFQLSLQELRAYMLSLKNSRSRRYLGHNPASSFAAMGMFISALALALSGLMMSFKINKHFFEETHEIFAQILLILSLLHITGVIFHQLKHHDGMIKSMVTGKKTEIPGEQEISSNHPLMAIILVVSILMGAGYLRRHFDHDQGLLSVLTYQIQLGENESHH